MAAVLPFGLYESGSLLGHRVAGITLKACRIGETPELAVKVTSLTNVANDAKISLIKDMRSLKGITHKNILVYTSIYVTSRSIFIEVKLMKGKSLSYHPLTHRRYGNLPELLMRDMLHQLSKRPDYLHKSYSGQIVHGNLIPEDIFYGNGAMLIASYGLLLPTNTFIHNSAAVIKVLPVRA